MSNRHSIRFSISKYVSSKNQILFGSKILKRLSWLVVVTNELFLFAEFRISICLIATVAAESQIKIFLYGYFDNIPSGDLGWFIFSLTFGSEAHVLKSLET